MTKNPFGQLGKKLLLLTLLLVTLSISALAADNNYLTFQSEDGETFTLMTDSQAKTWNEKIEYTISEPENENSWQEWNGTKTPASQTLYLRGTGNTTVSNCGMDCFVFGGDSQAIACTGNIMTLLDYEKVAKGEMPMMGEACFSNLFGGCTALTSAPELPAMTLTPYCYEYMFQYCTALTSAPQLPAEMLADFCYQCMFQHCTALTSAPQLPAEMLANFCYQAMFYGCTALTSAPEKLPATTLKESCYYDMFKYHGNSI